MKNKFLFSTLLLVLTVPAYATPKMITGKIIAGGGVDDMYLSVKTKTGKEHWMYCWKACGDWFENSDKVNNEVQGLKKSYINTKVQIIYTVEKNNDRIVGPSNEERLEFIQKVNFIK